MPSGVDLGDNTVRQNRICMECKNAYSIEDHLASSANYFDPPYNYTKGCSMYCLHCWLGLPDAHRAHDKSLGK
jgi:hypothetical protein